MSVVHCFKMHFNRQVVTLVLTVDRKVGDDPVRTTISTRHTKIIIRLLLRCSEERQPTIFLSVPTINVFVFETKPSLISLILAAIFESETKYNNSL
jgi:hypothetical protein